MKKIIPVNHVSADYNSILSSFINLIRKKQGDNLYSVLLTGSYARGEASDKSDIDLWCIFKTIDSKTLEDVGDSIPKLPVDCSDLELNAQCVALSEFYSSHFSHFIARPIILLEGVHLFGEEINDDSLSREEIVHAYKSSMAEILLSIRHYISANEPKGKLTYNKLKAYILKPFMFALRLERYCSHGVYPQSMEALSKICSGHGASIMIEWYMNQEKLEQDIYKCHEQVLNTMHDIVRELIE